MPTSLPLTPESPEGSKAALADASPAQPHGAPRRNAARALDLAYHRIRCTICKHPDRAAIEQDFLHWRSPAQTALEFNLGHCRAIYRHAHALGLFRQRAAQMRHSLGLIIEQASSVTPTADAIIRAVRAHACLDEDGRWHEPARRAGKKSAQTSADQQHPKNQS